MWGAGTPGESRALLAQRKATRVYAAERQSFQVLEDLDSLRRLNRKEEPEVYSGLVSEQ